MQDKTSAFEERALSEQGTSLDCVAGPPRAGAEPQPHPNPIWFYPLRTLGSLTHPPLKQGKLTWSRNDEHTPNPPPPVRSECVRKIQVKARAACTMAC